MIWKRETTNGVVKAYVFVQSHAHLFIALAMGSLRDLFANLCLVPCQAQDREMEPQRVRKPSFKEKAPNVVHVAPSHVSAGLVCRCAW